MDHYRSPRDESTVRVILRKCGIDEMNPGNLYATLCHTGTAEKKNAANDSDGI